MKSHTVSIEAYCIREIYDEIISRINMITIEFQPKKNTNMVTEKLKESTTEFQSDTRAQSFRYLSVTDFTASCYSKIFVSYCL